MRVHHLNCCTMCPVGRKLVNGEGGLFEAGRMVCHCLLVETNDGLILVDTGLGLDDMAAPRRRLGRPFVTLVRPSLDPEESALRQIERRGFGRKDLRHIVVTHLDLDHAGGLPDFPEAQVHVLDTEHDAAMHRKTLHEQWRYIPAHWAHRPKWVQHSVTEGEPWFGFDGVRAIEGAGSDVLLIPLHGHTRGHCGVAVKCDDGWLLHAGDAYFYHGELDPLTPRCTPALDFFQRHVAVDDKLRRDNQFRLRELARDRARDVHIFSAHDPVEFDRYIARAAKLEEVRALRPSPSLS
jgi:glyoxylase-like metal-dependent hydrolase (beta-lactamase superfamily II)